MEKAVSYAKGSGLGVVALLAVIAAAGLVSIIFEAATWEEFSDWMTKAVLVGIVVVALAFVVGLVASATSAAKK